MPKGRNRWPTLVAVVAAICAARGIAAAQLVDVNVGGATEEARGFAVIYQNQINTPEWAVGGSLVRVFRVTQPAGTVTIDATLLPSTAARLAQGPMSQQELRLHSVFIDTTFASALGPPDQPVQVEYDITYDANGPGTRVVAFTAGYFAARCGLGNAVCGYIQGYLVFLMRDTPRLAFGGAVRPRVYFGRPRYIQMGLIGVSPLTEITDVMVDDTTLTRVPSGVVPFNQSPGDNAWDRYVQDQVVPSQVIYPGFGPTSLDRFVGCGGGGCGVPGVRVGLPPTLGTGLHRVRIVGSEYDEGTYSAFGAVSPTGPGPGEPGGSSTLDVEEEFIVLEPQMTVSPPEPEPGATITITGVGFAPNSLIPVRFRTYCCTRYPGPLLGTPPTDLTGAFTLQAALAPLGAPEFATAWTASAPPGTPVSGEFIADPGDAMFLQRYGLLANSVTISATFRKPGATSTTTVPGSSTTTTVTSSTTTTTLPPVGCNPGDACDDADQCTEDACVAGACTHTRRQGAAAVLCAVPPAGLRPPVCAAEAPPPRAALAFDKATGFLDRAAGRARGATRRLVKKADKLLKRAKRVVEVAELTGDVSPACAEGIVEVVDGVRTRLGAVLDEL